MLIFKNTNLAPSLFVLVWIVALSLIFVMVTSIKYRKEIKDFVFKNLISIPEVSNLNYLQPLDYNNTQTYFILKHFCSYLSIHNFMVDDYLAFEYKKKVVEIVNFGFTNEKEGQRTGMLRNYLCLSVLNPENTPGKTVCWNKKKFKFNLPEKVETESPKFNQFFDVLSSSQIDARLHLKTNVMQDILDINTKLKFGEFFVYFYLDRILIIFESSFKSLEVNYKYSLEDPGSTVQIYEEIQLCLNIFDMMRLNRKAEFRS
jgi:hypothetical protein